MALHTDLRGIVTTGRGLSAARMADSPVPERIEDMLGIPVVLGTLNVRLQEPIERCPAWCFVPAEAITPDWQARTGRFGYFLVAVLVASRYRAMAFQADEPEYPANQLELIAGIHFRSELGLGDGDPVQLSLLQPELHEA